MNLAFNNSQDLTITSLLIAEWTGKRHSDVLRDIRKMEESWFKIAERKFALGSYLDNQNQERPLYKLTRIESMFVATKYSDELRAKLTIRWEELEKSHAKSERVGFNYFERLKLNHGNVPIGYFSVIEELFITLYKSMESVGYVIQDKTDQGTAIMPDISVGKGFSDYLQEREPLLHRRGKKYTHVFGGDRPPVQAKCYPEEALHHFRSYVRQYWIPEKAEAYFKKRDPIALEYLPKLLGA